MSQYTLTVNGGRRTVQADPDTPLLYVLRGDLELRGPRFGCGLGQCGACAVLLDGREARACITPVSKVAGRRIHTIEGLPALWAERESGKKGLSAVEAAKMLHPIQQAWIDQQVPQCGYCQSGMMIAAADLLERTPNPTVAQIKNAFTNAPPSPHLCRCGTYGAIIEAVQQASNVMAGRGGRDAD